MRDIFKVKTFFNSSNHVYFFSGTLYDNSFVLPKKKSNCAFCVLSESFCVIPNCCLCLVE